jgi:hypothetical protein
MSTRSTTAPRAGPPIRLLGDQQIDSVEYRQN